MALLMASGRLLDPRAETYSEGFAQREILRAAGLYYFWALLTPAIFWFSRRYSIERANWVRYAPLHLLVAFVVAILVDTYFDVLRVEGLPSDTDYKVAVDPLLKIQRLWFVNELVIYFAVLAAGFARDYFLRYRERREETIRLREQLAEARLETLRAQLNPHFLFNTLHAISTLVEQDPRGVRRMIARLSTLLRYTLEDGVGQEVPLEQELAFLRDYLDIQQIRFQGRLDVVEDVDSEIEKALVPSLILQPIVENAIKHGVSQMVGGGRIALRAHRDGDRLVLTVRDNGPGIVDGADPGPGFGLRNTRERLHALYGSHYALTFSNSPSGGTEARISIPYSTRADLRTLAVAVEAEEEGV